MSLVRFHACPPQFGASKGCFKQRALWSKHTVERIATGVAHTHVFGCVRMTWLHNRQLLLHVSATCYEADSEQWGPRTDTAWYLGSFTSWQPEGLCLVTLAPFK
eukprot:6235977-Amphidinium_carterae.1